MLTLFLRMVCVQCILCGAIRLQVELEGCRSQVLEQRQATGGVASRLEQEAERSAGLARRVEGLEKQLEECREAATAAAVEQEKTRGALQARDDRNNE